MLERPDIEPTALVDQTQYVPTMKWVANTLLLLARSHARGFSQPAVPTVAYYQDLDVSWTKPADPVKATTNCGDGGIRVDFQCSK